MLNSSYDLNFHFFKLHTQQLCTLHIPISQKRLYLPFLAKLFALLQHHKHIVKLSFYSRVLWYLLSASHPFYAFYLNI